jgi:hypothetical protein
MNLKNVEGGGGRSGTLIASRESDTMPIVKYGMAWIAVGDAFELGARIRGNINESN